MAGFGWGFGGFFGVWGGFGRLCGVWGFSVQGLGVVVHQRRLSSYAARLDVALSSSVAACDILYWVNSKLRTKAYPSQTPAQGQSLALISRLLRWIVLAESWAVWGFPTIGVPFLDDSRIRMIVSGFVLGVPRFWEMAHVQDQPCVPGCALTWTCRPCASCRLGLRPMMLPGATTPQKTTVPKPQTLHPKP